MSPHGQPTDLSPCTTRRQALGGLAGALCAGLCGGLLGGCATAPPSPGAPPHELTDLATGQPVTPRQWRQAWAESRYILLGERHDNPAHHALRGHWLGTLRGQDVTVVAEHLDSAAPVRWASASDDPLDALKAAGFDPRGWEWPLHEPLIRAVRDAALPLVGGNLPPEAVRRIAREGASALPADLAALMAAAPLPAAAQRDLDQALLTGHCGHLSPQRLPAMRLAQRARDAAMARALRAAVQDRPQARAVLLAGNGHVQPDHGVPVLLGAPEPEARLLIVLMAETGESWQDEAARWPRRLQQQVWLCRTAGVERPDPCAGWAPVAAASAPAQATSR